MSKKMLIRKQWSEFRKTGLLWWINVQLHLFGWAITVNIDEEGNIVEAYPSRCRFRGFCEQHTKKGYKEVSQYLKDNADELLEDSKL